MYLINPGTSYLGGNSYSFYPLHFTSCSIADKMCRHNRIIGRPFSRCQDIAVDVNIDPKWKVELIEIKRKGVLVINL
jgi:hypothetical protein